MSSLGPVLSSRRHAALALTTLAALIALPAGLARSEDKVPRVDFAKQVKPVLEAACVKCHGPKEAKGRYRLDSKAAAFKGGEVSQKSKQAAIVPGKADTSLLVVTIELTQKDPARHLDPMPPGKEERRLSDDEKALLRRWVAEGAPWPDKLVLTPPPDTGKPGGRKR